MFTPKPIGLACTAAVLAVLAGCSSTPPYGTTTGGSTPAPVSGSAGGYTTQMGRVSNIELVDAAQRPGLGAVLGAVVGAAVGNQVGSGTGRTAATGAGAVAGGVIGHQMEKRNTGDVYRVTVQFDNGAVQTFHFDQIGGLRIGDRVRYDGSQLYMA